MVFVLVLEGLALSCVLFEMGIVVLCIDKEQASILSNLKERILLLARKEFGNEIQDVRFFSESR